MHLSAGTLLELRVGGGGGFGPADERVPQAIAQDLLEGFVGEDYVRLHYPAQAPEAMSLRDVLLEELRHRSGR